LTVQMVADFFNERPGMKMEPLISELAEQHRVSDSTVSRRLRKAREKNLLS
jgi:hypothetical protein